jgi:Mn-dependent DtxR family transcriptional regulator
MELTPMQRGILLGMYLLKGRRGRVLVSRNHGSAPVVMTIGDRRLSSQRAVDALSDLYARGLVQQEKLNRFALTSSGRQLAKLLCSVRT